MELMNSKVSNKGISYLSVIAKSSSLWLILVMCIKAMLNECLLSLDSIFNSKVDDNGNKYYTGIGMAISPIISAVLYLTLFQEKFTFAITISMILS